MDNDLLLITEKDFLRIKNTLSFVKPSESENLEIELERARIISDNEVPPDLITMNSKVKFLISNEEKEMIVTIVYPAEESISEGRVSILSPLGSALIGLRAGQQINWQFPDKLTKTLKVLEVMYQPEANGHWHL